MTGVSVVGPADGEVLRLGPIQPAVLLNSFTPDLYVQYFRDLRDMIADGQALTPESTIAAMSRYATVLATDFASLRETP